MPSQRMDRTYYEQVCSLVVMQAHEFKTDRRRAWYVWAAKARHCSFCDQPAYRPCLNLTELKRGNEVETKWPHEGRVDWARMLNGLVDRGLWTSTLDVIARRRLKE